MGEYESFNFGIGLPSEDIALFHALYRTSIKGRKDLAALMFTDENDDGAIDGIIDKSYTSRVAEIFNVILKCLGMELDFVNEDDYVEIFDDNSIQHHEIEGVHYMCTNYQAYLLERVAEIRDEILEEYPVITEASLKKEIIARLKTRNYLNGTTEDQIDTFKMARSLMMTKKAIAQFEKAQEKMLEEISDEEYIEQDEYEESEEEEDIVEKV